MVAILSAESRAAIAVAIVLSAWTIGVILAKRKPDVPTQMRGAVPQQLSRQDFIYPHRDWLVVVFTSSTCDACEGVATKAQVLDSDQVAVQIVEFSQSPQLHHRYDVDSVPMLVIADSEGVVHFGTLGPITATDLWAASAKCRDPKLEIQSCQTS